MELSKLLVSRHYQYDRIERQEMIKKVLNNNWGSPVCKIMHENKWKYLTDTGMCFVVNKEETLIITAYIATLEQARHMFYFAGRSIPEFMITKVKKNNQKVKKFLKSA